MLTELAERRIGPPGDLEVLDVGCGPGETDGHLHGAFSALSGVDVSDSLVAEARRRNPWAAYSSYSAGEPLPYPDDAFDFSFAICVFHHVPAARRRDLAAEMTRVTRPGGTVAIFEHNPWNPLTRKAVRNCSFDEDAVLIRRREAASLLAEAGLGAAESAYIVFFPRGGRRLAAVERRLGKLPLGAQYYVAATPG